MLPANTRISPPAISLAVRVTIPHVWVQCLTISINLCSINGCKLYVDSEFPSGISIKSDEIFISSNRRTISFPMNPAVNPSAVFGIPKLLNTVETLIPFPPGRSNSNLSYLFFLVEIPLPIPCNP